MVLVAVREDHPTEFVGVFPEVCEVRQDQIYARHLLIRESQARVHQDHSAPLAHGGHVLADLPQTSEGHHLQGILV